LSNQRVQEEKVQIKIGESFAELLACVRNGTIQIGMANQPLLIIKTENRKIVLNLFPLKNLVNVNGNQDNGRRAVKLSLSKEFSEAKDFARCRKNNDLIVSMCYEDKEIIVLGMKAKPKLLKLIIGSNYIQIKNLRLLRRFDNEFFNV
jgi:hypothetical protein